MASKLLIPRQQYLASGIHIGMKQKTKDMKEFIYKVREDGLSILNLKKIDERIRIAAKFLARHKKILIVSKRSSVQEGIRKFAELIGAKAVLGRFMPGTLTNPSYKGYYEAEIVFLLEPLIDNQALKEAVKARIPVVAVCDTINETKNIDLIIPANNKGKKALATLLWLLAREILKERKEIKSDAEFNFKVEDFAKA
ncbi:MAG: 30S ribosomal protein S2 [Candidatus Aenigmatarchaeota archaeon]